MQIEKATGERPVELEDPDVPPQAEHLWSWFWELDRARGSNGFGFNAIGYGEIAAWAQLTGRRPSPWEVETLKAMDAERLAGKARS